MKRIILALLVLAVLVLSGCKSGVTGGAVVCNKPYILVGNDCCLDKDDNSVCDNDEVEPAVEEVEPPKEELEEEPVVEEVIEEVVEEKPEEIITTNEFFLKLGESTKFDGKVITLVRLDNIPLLKAVFDVDGVERDVIETKNLEIINGLEVTIIRYHNIENAVTVKLEKFELGEGEELVDTRTTLTKFGKEIIIKNILDKGEVLLDVIDPKTGDSDTKVIIKEGESATIQGITITNINGFPKGTKIDSFAIIKIE